MGLTRRHLLAVGGAVAGGGCLGVVDGTDAPTAADLATRLAEGERPETMIGTVETTFDRPDGTDTVTDEIAARADGATRVTGTTDHATYRNVDDGDRAWFHEVDRNRVAVMDSGATGESHIAYVYGEAERYFDALDATVRDASTRDGRTVYHVAFELPPPETVERSISVLVGTTEYVLPLETEPRDDGSEPADEASTFRTDVERIEVWFDRETLFPVEQVVETGDVDVRATYTDLALDDPIDDDRFAFDPPADALVEEHVFPYLSRYETLDAAEADAARLIDSRSEIDRRPTVAEPTHLPDGFETTGAAVVDYPTAGSPVEVSVRYADASTPGASIRVGAATGARPFDVAGEEVRLHGTIATVDETEVGTTVEWPRGDGVCYLFATAAIDRETALAVAESVDAEGDTAAPVDTEGDTAESVDAEGGHA